MIDVVKDFFSAPAYFARLVVRKLVFDPLKYSRGKDYDARGYWADRLRRHGADIHGPGVEGGSREKNEARYASALAKFESAFARHIPDATVVNLLEIGPGIGHFTDLVARRGVVRSTVVDITDALFPALRARHPSRTFAICDITDAAPGGGPFDCVVIIDVIEHIVVQQKLEAAARHIRAVLRVGGLVFIAPFADNSTRHMFHQADWGLADMQRIFVRELGFQVVETSTWLDPNRHFVILRLPTSE